MFEFFKKLTEDYEWILQASSLAGVFLLFFKTVRKTLGKVFKWAALWISFPFKGQTTVNTILTEVRGLKQTTEKTAQELDSLKKMIGYNGGSGLLDQVGILVGIQVSDFWMKSQPAFVCDENGHNTSVTHAYCNLLATTKKEDLLGLGWKGFSDREESSDYLIEFRDAASRRENFRGPIFFFNSYGEPCGQWVVVAHPISPEQANIKRYMNLVYPIDATAKEIAKKHDWPLTAPI